MSRTYKKVNPKESVYRHPKGHVQSRIHKSRKKAIPPSSWDDSGFSPDNNIFQKAIERMIKKGFVPSQIIKKIHKKFKIPVYLVTRIVARNLGYNKWKKELQEWEKDRLIKIKRCLIKDYWETGKNIDDLEWELGKYKSWLKHGKKKLYIKYQIYDENGIIVDRHPVHTWKSVKTKKAIKWLKEYIDKLKNKNITQLVRKER